MEDHAQDNMRSAPQPANVVSRAIRQAEAQRKYRETHRETIRAKKRQRRQDAHPKGSPELIEHLTANPAHALGKYRDGEVCSDCARLGCQPGVCFECDRMGFDSVTMHLRHSHLDIPSDKYREKHGYNRTRGLLSPAGRDRRSIATLDSRIWEAVDLKDPRRPGGTMWAHGPKWILRREGSQNLVKRRGKPPQNIQPESVQKSPDLWPIIRGRLQGLTIGQIADALKIKTGFPRKYCRWLKLNHRHPVRFWRGHAVARQDLIDLIRDSGWSEMELSKRMGVPIYRIADTISAKKGPKVPLKIDLADTFIAVRSIFEDEYRRKSPTSRGGHPHAVAPSQRKTIRWQRRVLLAEVGNLLQKLSDQEISSADELGRVICDLARDRKTQTLLMWALEFLPWVQENFIWSAIKGERPSDVVRAFLGYVYGQSENTIYGQSESISNLNLRIRTILLDVHRIFEGHTAVSTKEILAALRKHRRRWEHLNPKKLAAALLTVDVKPETMKVSGRVARGYRLDRLKLYSDFEAAHEFDVHPGTLRQWTVSGKIPAPPQLTRADTPGASRIRVWTPEDLRRAREAAALLLPYQIRPFVRATSASDYNRR